MRKSSFLCASRDENSKKGLKGILELGNHVQLSIMAQNYQQKLEKLQFWILIFSAQPENLRWSLGKRFIRDFDDFTPPSSKFHRDFQIIRSFMAVKGEIRKKILKFALNFISSRKFSLPSFTQNVWWSHLMKILIVFMCHILLRQRGKVCSRFPKELRASKATIKVLEIKIKRLRSYLDWYEFNLPANCFMKL